jgi:UDP-glucose:(heptosyl)LPS alpha-1,3-glucosyltransferase
MYAAADVFVLPTYYDACSLVVLEAMACGLPPITTETNGIVGILSDGENGTVLTHPPKEDELCQKMELLMDDAARKEMAEAAFRLGLQFTKKKNHRTMLQILNRQIRTKGLVQ